MAIIDPSNLPLVAEGHEIRRPYESDWCQTHLAAYLNGISVRQLRKIRSIPTRSVQEVFNGFRSRHVTDDEILKSEDSLVEEVSARPAQAHRWTPSVVDCRIAFHNSRLSYCSQCLKSGFHSPYFELPWVAECPRHNEPLKNFCKACNSWTSSEYNWPFQVCKCGKRDLDRPTFGVRDQGVEGFNRTVNQYVRFIETLDERCLIGQYCHFRVPWFGMDGNHEIERSKSIGFVASMAQALGQENLLDPVISGRFVDKIATTDCSLETRNERHISDHNVGLYSDYWPPLLSKNAPSWMNSVVQRTDQLLRHPISRFHRTSGASGGGRRTLVCSLWDILDHRCPVCFAYYEWKRLLVRGWRPFTHIPAPAPPVSGEWLFAKKEDSDTELQLSQNGQEVLLEQSLRERFLFLLDLGRANRDSGEPFSELSAELVDRCDGCFDRFALLQDMRDEEKFQLIIWRPITSELIRKRVEMAKLPSDVLPSRFQ